MNIQENEHPNSVLVPDQKVRYEEAPGILLLNFHAS